MEIKVGEYVRTDKGIITKIDKEMKNLQMLKFLDVEYGNIVKHSNNIINLIEIGDYVNGSRVIDIAQGKKKAIYVEQVTTGALAPILEKDIKSILTHEQFSLLEYII